jgi:hypothetical protein
MPRPRLQKIRLTDSAAGPRKSPQADTAILPMMIIKDPSCMPTGMP